MISFFNRNTTISGTCSNPDNENVEGFTNDILSNGRYPVGTRATVDCGIGFNRNSSYGVLCADPGIWIPRDPACVPNNDSKY